MKRFVYPLLVLGTLTLVGTLFLPGCAEYSNEKPLPEYRKSYQCHCDPKAKSCECKPGHKGSTGTVGDVVKP